VVNVNIRVVNESARETVGVASYNVSAAPPPGAYFLEDQLFLRAISA